MAKRGPAFLVTHGSFNPVHRHHLDMMIYARQRLEAAGFEVIRGIMGITPSSRLVQKGAEAVADRHRLAALQLGCDSVVGGWLKPDASGADYCSGNQFVRGLSPGLLAEAPDATIFKVIGADTAVRYNSELKGCTVVVCRKGFVEEVYAAVAKSKCTQDSLFIVEQLPGEECSSTKVREALRTRDVEAVYSMCPAAVGDYLLASKANLYVDPKHSDMGYASTEASSRLEGMRVPTPLAVQPVPSPGPGDGITTDALQARWAQTFPNSEVVGFYGHGEKAGVYRCFSNFFDQSDMPFDFVVPAEFCAKTLGEVNRVVRCEYSEKAIMLCKAAAMGDRASYEELIHVKVPSTAKAIGRRVINFEQAVWGRIVCSVAFEVVHQKFSKTPALQPVLLQTGDKLIAEATRNDKNWGIGIDVGDWRVQSPSKWQGFNVLGWALMESRAILRAGTRSASTGAAGLCVGESKTELPAATPATSKVKRWGKKS
eukprot:TRINITY_DN5064_c0_g1_i1.p1 TRINITY_DN5064_c0_g1~~TRINITY_DN5064_c0_g1_i1.p1  ORF type:complete len:504 (-),score=86.69 TRINITY_DN5064_c0_g1_i1:323-1774(-)